MYLAESTCSFFENFPSSNMSLRIKIFFFFVLILSKFLIAKFKDKGLEL